MTRQQLPPANGALVARRAREQFVQLLVACLAPMGQGIRARLSELAQIPAAGREIQDRRDAMMDFDRKGVAFLRGTAKAWSRAIDPPTVAVPERLESGHLELVGEDVVERKILSSRLALIVQEKAVWDLNDLKVRMQYLDGHVQAPTDILRAEALCQLLVEQWGEAGLSSEAWSLAQDVIQSALLATVPKAYKAINDFLVAQNVMRDIDLSARVKRAGRTPEVSRPPAPPAPPDGADTGSAGFARTGAGYGGFDNGGHGNLTGSVPGGLPQGGSHHDGAGARSGFGPAAGQGGYAGESGRPPGVSASRPDFLGSVAAGAPGVPGVLAAAGGGYSGSRAEAAGGRPDRIAAAPSFAASGSNPAGRGAEAESRRHGRPSGVADETRMMTSSPPLARARARATGVLGQLKRLLTDRVPSFDGPRASRPSPGLAEAMERPAYLQDTVVQAASTVQEVVYDNAAVQEAATDLRRRTGELKKKAETSTEKATIEIVALMFQSILAEERIPPAIRVWFARLQMPVLRVAIAEPEFFESLEHPARQLIDRLGSCVMGFDAAAINGTALELEIKRVVQVIEQYPETGRRVFQLVYDEFHKFLSRYLTEAGATQKLVSVAQQVEQKETLAIQYTIELRAMLADLPIRDEIRGFLFKVWAEVLAVAAVRHGPQHDETLALKAAASELVWAAGAKPNRSERAKVIQDLPKLLQRLRQGMTMIGTVGKDQEAHIKTIGETLADAFLSKTEAISHERIEAMSKRLAHLEDFVADDPATDLPLDRDSIELMLGIDASMIEVIADGGSKPNAAMLAWAVELQLGNWFGLDHNGASNQVQYVWRSERRQLHLFAAPGGRSYLIQARRLAAYLQAGLLLPAEEETLTVRATRDALAKLDANPERLLH